MKELKLAIIGAGTQAKAVLDYFLRYSGATEIGILDKDPEPIGKLLKSISESGSAFRNLSTATHPIESDEFVTWMSKFDAAISCAPYFLNKILTKQAIKAKTNFTDLGGNNDIVNDQFAMSKEVKEAGILVVPDLGLAPGMTGLLGADLVRSLNSKRSRQLIMRVGGLPVYPKSPLNYNLSFSIHGLLNEYLEDCDIIDGGERTKAPGLSGLEHFRIESFRQDIEFEAFFTSGGSSTLPQTLLGEVDYLNYKTIRYKGHCDIIKLLRDLGYFDPEHIEDTKKRLEKVIPVNQEDVIIMSIIAECTEMCKKIELVDYGLKERGLSAMAKCTGYPAAIITSMIGRGEVNAKGVVPQENCIDVSSFKHFLLGCGINLVEKQHILKNFNNVRS